MPADRTAYNNCMKPYMRGSGEDKRLSFCVGAKVCSGKAASEDQARQICLTEPHGEPKPRKSKKNCGTQMLDLANCVVGKLTPDALSSSRKLNAILTDILQECQCGKITRVPKRKRAIEEISPEELEALESINAISGIFNPEKENAAA